jgi:plastocyanin
MTLRTPTALVAVLAVGATLGATIGSATATPRRPAQPPRRCNPRGRHRCPPAHHTIQHCRPRRHHPCPKPHKRRTKQHAGATKTTPGPRTVATAPTSPTVATTPVLPSRLEVDENDQGVGPQPYSLTPSHDPVAAGTVQFNVYNFGQDDHTFAVKNAGGQQVAFVDVPANQSQTAVPVSLSLPPGHYTLECTLAGHAGLGMRATLTVW